MKKVIALAKKLYAIRAVDRGLWTLAEAAVAVAVTKFGGKVYYGVSAATVLFMVKEYVIAKLAKVGGPIVIPTVPPVV